METATVSETLETLTILTQLDSSGHFFAFTCHGSLRSYLARWICLMQQRGCDSRDVHISGCLESLQWKEGADSSGSETGKQELDDDFPQDTHSLDSNVLFTVGDRCVCFFSRCSCNCKHIVGLSLHNTVFHF